MPDENYEYKYSTSSFDTPQNYVDLCKEKRKKNKERFVYGLDFLDNLTGGIRLNEFVIITGKSGRGKTTLAHNIVYANSKKKDTKIYNIVLEAEKGEATQKTIYSLYADQFYKKQNHTHINYRDFIDGVYDNDPLLKKIEHDFLYSYDDSVVNFYRGNEKFGTVEFCVLMNEIREDTTPKKLVVIDHLHYWDFDDKEDNTAFKNVVKTIRDVSLIDGVAIVLLAHIRKSERKSKSLCPTMEDIQGSSDIFKPCTQFISLSPYNKVSSSSVLRPTLMRVDKFRIMDQSQYIALCYFDTTTNSYQKQYELKKPNWEETELLDLSDDEYPFWYPYKPKSIYQQIIDNNKITEVAK